MPTGKPMALSKPSRVIPKFYVVSIRKLVYMTMLTTGLYVFYWFYRNWAAYRYSTGNYVNPILRSVFPVLFVYSLVSRIDQALKDSRVHYNWSPRLVGMGMWLVLVLCLGSGLLAPLPTGEPKHDALVEIRLTIEAILQLAGMLWVMCRIQLAINVLEGDPRGEANSRSTRAGNGWMMFGVTLWMFIVMGLALNLSIAF